MECDVLIVYEHRARELENACLLAVELELRGYSVQIRHIESLRKYFISARVVITPHLYNNKHVLVHAKNFWKNHKNLISLQYEQVLSSTSEDVEDIHDPKEEAVFAQHIAWGPSQRNRYLAHGINVDHVHMTGCISMDLMYSEFDNYFKSKSELAEQFGLDEKKDWILFMSSFSYTDRTEEEIKAFERVEPTARVFARLSERTRDEIMHWLEQACCDFDDKEIIYRPHPHEKSFRPFQELTRDNKNFHVIGDYSVRQWVRSSDKLFTWYSTSIADAFFADKYCGILRPISIPDSMEVALMLGAQIIDSYSGFKSAIRDGLNKQTINEDRLTYYYGQKGRRMAFLQIADLCERMMKGGMEYDYNYGGSRFNILNENKFRRIVITYIWHLLCDLTDRVTISNYLPKLFFNDTLKNFEKENYHLKDEINDIKSRLRPIIRHHFHKAGVL